MKSRLVNWVCTGDAVVLFYSNYNAVVVMKNVFERAFGAIVNASYNAVVRDFSIAEVVCRCED